MRPFETAGGTQNRTFAVLNREHAMLLMTYMRNTLVIRDFKKRLIHAFMELETRAQAPAALPDDLPGSPPGSTGADLQEVSVYKG